MNIPVGKTAEKLICEPFEKLLATHATMTDQNSEMFKQIAKKMPEDLEEGSKQLADFKTVGGYKFIDKTLTDNFTIKMCPRSKMLLIHLSQKHYIISFVYLCYIQYKANKSNIFEVDFVWLCEKVFPDGFLQPADLFQITRILPENIIMEKLYLNSINYTAADLKDYADAKQEAQGYSDDFKKSITGPPPPEPKGKKFSAMDLLNKPGFLQNLNKKKK